MPLHPMVFACLMGVTIDSCSNIIAQRLKTWNESQPFVFDRVLFLQFVCLSIIAGPLNYNWQCWLERTFPGWKTVEGDIELAETEKGLMPREDGEDKKALHKETRVRNWSNIFKKWFMDCITLGALLNTSLFLLLMGILKGKTILMIKQDFRDKLFRIIWDSYKIWPIANFISTTYCPVERRIIFLSLCGLIWNIYLSLVAARL